MEQDDIQYQLETTGLELINHLLEDQDFVEIVAEKEIKRLVAEGVLIPAERLQVADNLRLVDATRFAELERLAGGLIEDPEPEDEPEGEPEVEEEPSAPKDKRKLDPDDAPFECSVCGEFNVDFEAAQVAAIMRKPITCPNCAGTPSTVTESFTEE